MTLDEIAARGGCTIDELRRVEADPRLRAVVETLLAGTENSRSIVELADKVIALCGASAD